MSSRLFLPTLDWDNLQIDKKSPIFKEDFYKSIRKPDNKENKF